MVGSNTFLEVVSVSRQACLTFDFSDRLLRQFPKACFLKKKRFGDTMARGHSDRWLCVPELEEANFDQKSMSFLFQFGFYFNIYFSIGFFHGILVDGHLRLGVQQLVVGTVDTDWWQELACGCWQLRGLRFAGDSKR